MTKTQFRLGVAAIFAAILLYNLTNPNRYTSIQTGAEVIVTDGVTGKVWTATPGSKWMSIGK